MATKQEIIADKVSEYTRGNRQVKARILHSLMETTGYRRKALIRRLRQLTTKGKTETTKNSRSGRPRVYDNEVTAALKCLWDLSHECSGERLQPQLDAYVDSLKRFHHWSYSPETTTKLQAMSMATVKRRIAGFRNDQTTPGPRGISTTKPSELKELIPIRRGPWDNPPPGFGEIDTVVHCGSSLVGDLTYTAQYTDVATIWVLLAAQWNKGKAATKESITRMRKRLPFAMLGLDPDSGSEFINWHLYDWCKKESIQLTRIRPGKKNDHGRVEQKNYANVRQFIGYVRLDRQEQVILLQNLYDVLEDYLNFFIPVRKCIRKERTGSRYQRVYDKACTPYARVLERTDVPEDIKQELRAKYQALDLVAMKKCLDDLTEALMRSCDHK